MDAALRLRATCALLGNAMVWGLSWWPMRQLEQAGWHPLWATALIFALACAYFTLVRPLAWAELARHPALWLIVLVAGGTNACFNWGVTVGDVARVVLLFYLMPLWAVLLARWLLHEPITRLAMLRVALSLAGAAIVLWPPEGSRAPALSLADGLGLMGGLCFALNNILLRRERARTESARGLAMFFGGGLVALLIALAMRLPAPALPTATVGAGAAVLGLVFLCSNLALQYGASRLPAAASAVIMLTEVLWATGSAIALGAGVFSPELLAGGILIVGSALLAALPSTEPRNA